MALGDEIKSDINRKVAGLSLLGNAIGKHLEKKGRSNASWTDRTGNTRRAIRGGSESRPNGVTIYLAHGSEVGLFMEEGTKPYTIRPKNKKVLRFTAGGDTIFTKQVNHPGIAARPVVGPTVASSISDVKREVRRYWEGT